MRGGELVAGRFVVETLAGSGGMGQVYRALDRHTGESVALKVLTRDASAHVARFAHEAQALAELSHPHIVRYVAHGVAEEGEPYLAMEWLEGEDLTSRLVDGPLPIEDCLQLGSRLAEALGAAHAQGIVHRDLKPSNVFLPDFRLEAVKIIDFGIARLAHRTHITRTGMLVGTPGYMAPEQAQDGRVVDLRADVFSLGCVLFECVTGTSAFTGEHMMAVLAKVLFADPPRLCELRPEAPVALEQLVMRMLAKDPEARVRDCAAVLEALAVVDAQTGRGGALRPVAALTRGERRTLSVVLIEGRPSVDRDTPSDLEDPRRPNATEVDETLDLVWGAAVVGLRRGAEAFGGRLEPLHDGSLVVSIGGTGLPTDRAVQAARCALWVRRHLEGRALALATGHDEATGRMAVAEAIDRAAALLLARADDAAATASNPAPIVIDETTARLLDGRFDVRESDTGSLLHGERELERSARLLLNRPTACVGRDRELAMLADLFAGVVEEPEARAVSITGPAGIGKSRVVHELLARLRQRGEPFTVFIGRGDALRAGAALGLLGQVIRGACGIRGDEPLAERRDKLAARVRQLFDTSQQRRVLELLGEITGATFPDHDSELLRAVRSNARIMTDELRRAWLDFLRAECNERPVLLVLENLHFGDLPTVQFIDAALRELAEQPWMVLALARPEVHELFPKLWAERGMQEISLKQLSKKASERLVRQVLGTELDSADIERIVAQADGNAFYLEELIRAAAERSVDVLPETVVAMVQARLAGLEDEDRRVLRAAAVFGEVFWPRGVAALLGWEERPASVEQRLRGLVERELLVRSDESRFAGEPELGFRHVLLREGAYAMLTGPDRVLGHRLAGEWLERAGERDSKLLAVHFDRGGDGRAAAYYLRAAEQALEVGDHKEVLALAGRGIMVAHEPGSVAGLRAIEGEASVYCGDLQRGREAATAALELARPGSRTECRALHAGLLSAFYLRDEAFVAQTLERLLHTDPEPDAIPLLASASFSVMMSLVRNAQRGLAELHLRRLEQVTADVMAHDPVTAACVELSRSMWAFHVERDPWALLEHAERAAEHYRRSGGVGMLPFVQSRFGVAYSQLGLFERAEQEFTRTLATALTAGMEAILVRASQAFMWIEQGRIDDGFSMATSVVHEASTRGDRNHYWMGRALMIEIQIQRGDFEADGDELHALLEEAAAEPYAGMWYLTVCACARLAQGRAQEAAALADLAFSRSRSFDIGYCIRHAKLLLVRAEAFHALGEHQAARSAIAEARDDVLRRAARIPDAAVRRSFLENILDHRRTLELARQWLGEAGVPDGA